MITVRVALIAYCPNINSSQIPEFLCVDGGGIEQQAFSFPAERLSDGNRSEELAKKLFSSCLEFSPSWVTLQQFGVLEVPEERDVYILYACMIPERIKVGPWLKWVTLDELSKQRKPSQDAVIMMAMNKCLIG